MHFRIHYGIINAAQATISSKEKKESNLIQINVKGETTGVFSVITPISDEWISHISSENFKPKKTFFRKRENNYRKSQTAHYNYEVGAIQVEDKNNKNNTTSFPMERGVTDMLGAYAEIRNEPIDQWPIGKRISKKIFIEDQVFRAVFSVKAEGSIEVNKKIIPSKLLIIQFPKNGFLSEKEDIRLWVSNDGHHIPVKIEVDLKIGHISIDLTSYHLKGKRIY